MAEVDPCEIGGAALNGDHSLGLTVGRVELLDVALDLSKGEMELSLLVPRGDRLDGRSANPNSHQVARNPLQYADCAPRSRPRGPGQTGIGVRSVGRSVSDLADVREVSDSHHRGAPARMRLERVVLGFQKRLGVGGRPVMLR